MNPCEETPEACEAAHLPILKWCGIIVLCLLTGVTPLFCGEPKEFPVAKENYPFIVRIENFFGAEGFWVEYYVGEERVAVVVGNDFGNPRRELLNRPLSKDEAATFQKYLASFPLDALKTEYVNRRIHDGLQRFFIFHIGAKQKAIAMRNVDVPELFDLCDKVNTLVPENLQMHGGGASASSGVK